MRNKSDDSLLALITICVVLVGLACYAMVRSVAGLFHLDMASSVWLLIGIAILLIVTVGILFYLGSVPEHTWPLLLVGLWLCFWKPIQYWASSYAPFEGLETFAWWGDWYTRWGVLAALLGFSYLHWQRHRY